MKREITQFEIIQNVCKKWFNENPKPREFTCEVCGKRLTKEVGNDIYFIHDSKMGIRQIYCTKKECHEQYEKDLIDVREKWLQNKGELNDL